MAKKDLIVIGELNVDMIITGLESLPVLGTEKMAKSCDVVLGSSSAIFACAAANLGLDVGFIGKVGSDDYGDFIMRYMKEQNIDLSAVVIDKEVKTGITVSLTFPEDRALFTYPGTIETFNIKDIDMDYVKQGRHLHIAAFYLQKGLSKDVPFIFEEVKKAGMTTSFDTGFDPDETWEGGVQDVLKNADIFMPNEVEVAALSREKEIDKAIDVMKQYPKTLAVKLGSKGSVGIRDSKKVIGTPFPVTPVDTTGAGDSFNAGFVYGFLNDYSLEDSLVFGNAVGALSTQNIGGASNCSSYNKVKKFIETHKK